MKAARLILFFGLILGWAVASQADQRDVLFAQGNAAFQSGKFAAAESEYRKLIQAGKVSEDVFFNLGNAIFRQNRPGEAALWFQRARVFDPRMTEANQNLTFLQKTHGYLEIERKPLDAFLFNRKPTELTIYAWIGAWVFLLSLAAMIIIRKLRDWRPLLIIISLFGLSLAIAAIWAGSRRSDTLAIEKFAVVKGGNVSALTAPAPGAEAVIALPPGSEVRILQDRGPWKYVDIPGELRGWVDSKSVAAIWPLEQ